MSQLFGGIIPTNRVSSTPDKLIFSTPSGDRLVLNGTGFDFDPFRNEPWGSGTITSIEFRDRTLSTEFAVITGLSIDLSAFGSALGEVNEWAISDLVFAGADVVNGGNGNDNLYSGAGNDTINGGDGYDFMLPGAGVDFIDGGSGTNSIAYWNFTDSDPSRVIGMTINLGAGFVDDPWGSRDTFTNVQGAEGTRYNDIIIGTEANNELIGGFGDNNLIGFAGDDTFYLGSGNDTADGGAGDDLITYDQRGISKGVNVNLSTGVATNARNLTDTLISIERVRGTVFVDTITGSTADESFQGLDGADIINGGGGVDTIDFSRDYRNGGLAGVEVNLGLGTAKDGFGKNDSVTNVENVIGTQYADTITGNEQANLLTGGAGDDKLTGDGGNDTLVGGAGNDVLRGGAGNDTALFTGNRADYTFSKGANSALRFASWRADNREVYALYEQAAKMGIKTFIFHKALTDGPVPLNPYRLDDIDEPASLFPDMHFQIVHGGMAFMDETAQAIARYPNVSVNMEVTTLLLFKAPEWFADILGHFFWWGGPEKVVWSSGSLFAHPRPLIERFWHEFEFPQHILDKFGLEQITKEQKKLVLGENACRILGIDIEAAKAKIKDDWFSRKLAAEGYAEPWSRWTPEQEKAA